MKTLPLAYSALALTLALSIGATIPVRAALPTGYTYMEPPPPGYGTVQAPPQKTSAPKPSSTPKSTPPRSYTPQYSAPSPQYQQPAAPTYAQPRQQTLLPAPKPVAAPKPKSTTSAPSSYGPLPSSQSLSLAKIAANDKQQDTRIRRLEGDVTTLKTGSSSRFVSTTSSPKGHTTYVVRPGDSLWRIASANRVSPGEIMALNHMKSDSVNIGQALLIPSAAGSSTTQASYKPLTHEVRPGDNSIVIAKKYGVTRAAVFAANPHVDFAGGLIPGSRVNIPGRTVRVDSPIATSSGGSYTVKSGDSLKAIAIRHGMSTATLAAANGIKDYNRLNIGQRLAIPGGRSFSVATKSPSKSKPVSSASDDTIPLPGVGLPPPPVLAPAPIAQTPPPAPKSTAPVSDTHRGVLAYRVDNTDNIDSIAQQFGTTPQRIREMNHLQPSTKLNSGDEIMVPAMGAVSVN